ncbi:MAG: universal stress protein [Candidatus Thermoplasmatota archaeon]|nr:universal stress protein [Candidatus Thermoplasmatota archaeon]MBS3790956.1 universal stress protein [Candidatus Thermoplasmatota archaeon]
MYERVIVPTDGSELAKRGVLKGLELAKELDIPAYSIFVLNLDDYEELKGNEARRSVKNNMKKVGENALRRVRKRAHDLGVDITTEILLGKPYERIAMEAGENDVICMSSHGASGFKEFFLGSTTERVLKNAECTVIVVKER